MSSRCVFCGNTAVNKNNEHVLPRWMIRASGRPNRTIRIDATLSNEIKTIGWDSFRFPACSDCNTRYSLLEGISAEIVKKLSDNVLISPFEWETFLDWVDKLRVGFWLGKQLFWREDLGRRPDFCIDRQIGRRDTLCWVFRTPQRRRRLGLLVVSPLFECCPNHFSFFFNRLAVVQYTDSQVGQRLVPDWRHGTLMPNLETVADHVGRTKTEYAIKRSWMTPDGARVLYRPRESPILGDNKNTDWGYYRPSKPIIYYVEGSRLIAMNNSFTYGPCTNQYISPEEMLYHANLLTLRVQEDAMRGLSRSTPSYEKEEREVWRDAERYAASLRRHFEDPINFARLAQGLQCSVRYRNGEVQVTYPD